MKDQTPPNLLFPAHGGDLAGAEARFGKPADGWLDLSTGINPLGWPVPALDAEIWRRLPDGGLMGRCLEAAARYYGVGEQAAVVAAPGSQAIIQALPTLVAPSRVTILAPTYAEHAAAWAAAGHTVEEREDVPDDASVVVVVNPNNPDGRLFDPTSLAELAAALRANDGLLVVDEAFGDLIPEASLAAQAGPGLVVLRSVGKFFGLGGIRLGFALCEPDLANALHAIMGPWAVSGPSLAVGVMALTDEGWIANMRKQLAREAQLMDELLTNHRLDVIGGTDLFKLVQAPRAWALYEHLAQRGVLVRAFAHNHRILRFGLPAGHAQRRRLDQALSAWRG